MRCKQRVLIAALAIVAFSSVSISSAQASSTFTAPGAPAGETTTTKILKDGTGKTSHQVFDLGNSGSTVSMTCEAIEGTGHIIGPQNSEITLITPALSGCQVAGQPLAVTNTGCDFRFTASGEVHIVSEAGKECSHGKQPIIYTFPGCKFEIGAQTINGIAYHNLADGTITVERNNLQYTYNAIGAACEYGTLNNGTWTTGNFILTGERPTGTMVELKWDS
jgi:hypothetical protein